MSTTQIPVEEKRLLTADYSMPREGRSDAQLLVDLLDKVANDILFYDIITIAPVYTESMLALTVHYKGYYPNPN